MNVKEFADKFGVNGHYAKDKSDWKRNPERDVMAYVFGGSTSARKDNWGRYSYGFGSPSWAMIFRGQKTLFCYINGRRVELADAVDFIKDFKSEKFCDDNAIALELV